MQMAAFWQEHLGARLIGVYCIGSLAHGGFSSRYSDIDVAVIAEDGLVPAELQAARDVAKVFSSTEGTKLSMFWSDRAFSIGRFPPLDRVDYVDHAVPLFERERVQPARPSLSAIRTYLRGQPLASWRDQVQRFSATERLGPGDHKPYLRALLYPARFIFSWITGQMTSNDDSVSFLQENTPEGLDIDLIERALECRHEAQDLDGLLPERGKLAGQFAICVRLAEVF